LITLRSLLRDSPDDHTSIEASARQ
jgi:hypothetical protein